MSSRGDGSGLCKCSGGNRSKGRQESPEMGGTAEPVGTARKLGKVPVDLHRTTCKVPVALDYISKIEASGRVGKKRRSVRC